MVDPPSDEEIAARLRKVREELANFELPTLSEEESVERKTAEITANLESKDVSRFPEVPEWGYQRKKTPKEDMSHYRGIGVGLSVAYTMLGCVLAGWGLGKLIDLGFHSVLFQAVGTLVGGIGALVSAIYIITKHGDQP